MRRLSSSRADSKAIGPGPLPGSSSGWAGTSLVLEHDATAGAIQTAALDTHQATVNFDARRRRRKHFRTGITPIRSVREQR